MKGESKLDELIKTMMPELNKGEYVFVTVTNVEAIDRNSTVFEFKEAEGVTVVLEKHIADTLNLKYGFIAGWITLKVFSSLEAVGLTAAFSQALAKNNISCNVVAGFYHDHIFVDIKDVKNAIIVLEQLSKEYM